VSKEKVGSVTTEEKNEILEIFKRKKALEELMASFADKQMSELPGTLYEKIIRDFGDTLHNMEKWWKTMSQKYAWKSSKTGRWEIDFESNDIFLVDNM
jgi:CXXX repeat modification system protein